MSALGLLLAAVLTAALTTAPSGDLVTQIRSAPSHSWIGFQLPNTENSQCDCEFGQRGPVTLYFHVVDHQIDRVKPLSAGCRSDLRGDPAQVIEPVTEAAADDALIELARHDPSSSVRRNTLFWLAVEAGRKAGGALREAVDDDPDTRVKTAAVFGISMLPDDESIPLLIDLAKNHPNHDVRRKAVFWLGQKHDPRATEALVEIVRR